MYGEVMGAYGGVGGAYGEDDMMMEGMLSPVLRAWL